VHAAGYLTLALPPLRSAPRETALRALARCVLTVGDGGYTPRLERLERLHAALAGGSLTAQTLAGCRIQRQGEQALVCREAARAAGRVAATPGAVVRWDGRFEVGFTEARVPSGTVIARLGSDGWSELVQAVPSLRGHPIPSAVRPTLPALWRKGALLEVPHLDWRTRRAGPALVRSVSFAPRHPLAGTAFAPSEPALPYAPVDIAEAEQPACSTVRGGAEVIS
jgi:tRNA(Ile)-lysidine synthase